MLGKFSLILSTIIYMCGFTTASAATGEGQGVQWLTDYEAALQESKSNNKPLLLFFTGSDWCGWCTKMDEEVLGTKEFGEAVASKFVFLKLDFPLYAQQDPKLKAQNKQLQERFQVRSFPTIILLDTAHNQQIGTTGYRPGGGKAFGEHLIKMINEYTGYKEKISVLDMQKMSGSELKQLYAKAVGLNLRNDVERIMEKGLTSNESLFFSLELYRVLVSDGKIHDRKAMMIREQILSADPYNEKLTQYQIALIDFQAYCNEMNRNLCDPEFAVAPLLTYIQKYGKKDRENPWRLKFLISQIYLDRNEMTIALKYAQESYDTAPASVQPEIGLAIHKIRTQVHSSG